MGSPSLRWVPLEPSGPRDAQSASFLVARSGHSAVVLQQPPREARTSDPGPAARATASNKLLIFGGLSDKKFLGDCLLFDPGEAARRGAATLAMPWGETHSVAWLPLA